MSRITTESYIESLEAKLEESFAATRESVDLLAAVLGREKKLMDAMFKIAKMHHFDTADKCLWIARDVLRELGANV